MQIHHEQASNWRIYHHDWEKHALLGCNGVDGKLVGF
jgi:hypothetical protein